MPKTFNRVGNQFFFHTIMKQSFIFFAILLLFSGLQGCKKTTDAEPDWASGMAGTYKGRGTLSLNYPMSVTLTKLDAKTMSMKIVDPAGKVSDFEVPSFTLASATAFTATFDPYNNGKGYVFTGTLSGNTLTMPATTSGQALGTFTGSK